MKLIELTPLEVITAAHVAGQIRGVKKVQHARGEVRNRRVAAMDDFEMHYLGMLGEVAVARELGLPVRSDLTVGGDDFTDLEFRGATIQIKTSGHDRLNRERLVFLNGMHEFRADWLIACSLQGPASVAIHGFISRKKFEQRRITHNFGYGERACVKESDLSGIELINKALEPLAAAR